MSIPYDPRSTRAEEFINDEEVLASLAYGEENKNNAALIDQLLDKVMTFKGLTHREAAVLLANDDPEVTKRIFDAAIKVKEHIYGKRIVLFQLLHQRLHLLPVSRQEQAHRTQEAHDGGNRA